MLYSHPFSCVLFGISTDNAGLLMVRSHPKRLYKKPNHLNTTLIIKAKTSHIQSSCKGGIHLQNVTGHILGFWITTQTAKYSLMILKQWQAGANSRAQSSGNKLPKIPILKICSCCFPIFCDCISSPELLFCLSMFIVKF